MTEPRTPQSLAQLRDAAIERHQRVGTSDIDICAFCDVHWPCDAYLLATALSVENVAAGLAERPDGEPLDHWPSTNEMWRSKAAALLEAIPVGGETPA